MAWSVKGVGAAQACTLWLLSNLNGSARSGNERSGGVEGKRVFAMHLASALSIITLLGALFCSEHHDPGQVPH